MGVRFGRTLNWNKLFVVAGFGAWMAGCSAFHQVAIVRPGEDPATKIHPDEISEKAPSLTESLHTPQVSDTATNESVPSPPEPPVIQEPQAESIQEDILAQPSEETMRSQTLTDVFFDYDQYMVRLDAIPALEQNAKLLIKRFKGREVIIQGHCDERGTEEYNLILGDRRATAVKNFLTYLGVPASSLRVLSLGKAQPFCISRTPECLRLNRRAHFVLQ